LKIGISTFLLIIFYGCSGDSYFKKRTYDFIDIIDLKGSLCIGLGAKIEATDYISAGIGVGGTPGVTEKYGRVIEGQPLECAFAHLIIFGKDGSHDNQRINILLYTYPENERHPLIFRFRFGGEILLPIVSVGAYINTAELLDFVLGIFDVDIANDDQLEYGIRMHEYVRMIEDKTRDWGGIKETKEDMGNDRDSEQHNIDHYILPMAGTVIERQRELLINNYAEYY
jgi:hypothetical protein